MPRKARQVPECHPDRAHLSKGLCCTCYNSAYNYARRTGTTFTKARQQVLNMLGARSNVCEICGTDLDLVVDRDHKTGAMRGFLCRKHNSLLGFVKEDLDELRNSMRYLMRKEAEYARSLGY